MKRLVIIVLSVLAVCQVQAEPRRLWYDKAASHWLEALPIGNSSLGAMVYGGADTEQIQLNEETFWSDSEIFAHEGRPEEFRKPVHEPR